MSLSSHTFRPMHIILGANGHVGSALAQALLDNGEAVTVVLHSPEKAHQWQQQGAQVEVADVHDIVVLRRVFGRGQRLFLLNPPAAPSSDTASQERKSLACILAALKDSGLEKVVAQSTYGAQPGERLDNLGVLYEMEQALAAQSIPATIIRGAYYLSNWDAALQTAREKGQVPTFYPADFKLPMVAPHDIGQLAAQLMTAPVESHGVHAIEGPTRYSSAEVAQAFSMALGQSVEAVETPREQWLDALEGLGFSDAAAHSFAAMTAATLEGRFPEAPERGVTSLQDYVNQLVCKNPPTTSEK